MQQLSMMKLFLKEVKRINPAFREFTSSLSSLFKEMRTQTQSVCLKGAQFNNISHEALGRVITKVQRKGDAQKYGQSITWLQARWGYNNDTIGNGVGQFWSLLELEDQLYGIINKKLEQNNFQIGNDLKILYKVLTAQHDLVASKFDTAIKRNCLLQSFLPLDQQYANRLNGLIDNNPARPDQWSAAASYDLNKVLTLAIIKMNAFETGRNLLNRIGEIRGNRRLNLSTAEGYKADFIDIKPDPSLRVMKSNLGLPDFIEARFKQTGTKYFDESLTNLYKIAARRPLVNSDISLVFFYRPYSWHQIHIGQRSADRRIPQLTWYLSPHYIQVYHELCHVVRLLDSTAFPLEPQILPAALVESYGNTEEYFNIRVAKLSEWALLKEIGEYPLRLTHSGVIIPAPSNSPRAHPFYDDQENTMPKYLNKDINDIKRKAQNECGL